MAPRLPFAYVTLTDGSPRAALVYMVYALATYIHTHCSWKANTTTSLRPSKANAATSPPRAARRVAFSALLQRDDELVVAFVAFNAAAFAANIVLGSHYSLGM